MSAPWDEIDRIIEAADNYDTTAEAAMQAAVLAFNHAADRCGLTGFQASWAALSAYAKIMHYDCPLIVLKGEDMLYPQYDLPERLAKWMDECRPWLAEQAQKKLDEHQDDEFVVGTVREHWRKLAAYEAEVVDALTQGRFGGRSDEYRIDSR